MQITLIFGIVFALFIAVFSIQNAGPVSLAFFTWQFKTSLVVVVLGGVALGAIVMWLFSSVKQFKLKREIKKLNYKIEELNTELRVKDQRLEEELNNNANTDTEDDIEKIEANEDSEVHQDQ